MLLSVTEIFGVVYILQYKNSLPEELILCPATHKEVEASSATS